MTTSACDECGTACHYPGKFEGNPCHVLAEHLYELTMDGMLAEETGEVDGPIGWNGLLLTGDRAFIVHEDSQGFFDYQEYDSERDARIAWSELETEASAYESEETD